MRRVDAAKAATFSPILGDALRIGLTGGGNRIRTVSPAEKETAVERGPAADHRRLARRPVLNDPIQLIGPASLVGNSRETLHTSGTDGSNPVPSSSESGELPYCRRRLDPDRLQRLESAALVQMRRGSRCTAPVTTTGRGYSSRVDVMRRVRRCSETARARH